MSVELDALSYLAAFVLSGVVGAMLPPRIQSVADAVTVPLGYVGVIPAIWMLQIYAETYSLDASLYGVLLTGGFAALVVTSRFRLRILPPMAPIGRGRADQILVLVSLAALAWITVGFGLSLELHSLVGNSIYGTRLERRADLEASILLANEALFTLSFFLAPLLTVRGLEQRRYAIVALGVFSSIAAFSLSAQRAPVVATALAASLYLARRLYRGRFPHTVSVAVLVTAAIDLFQQIPLLTEVGFRRLVAIPAIATVWYFDFQVDHEPTYMRDSLLGFAGDSPYDSSVARIIGRTYTWSGAGESLNNANTGVFGSSVTTFGLIGLLLVPVALGLYLGLVDGLGGSPSVALLSVTSAFTLVVLLNGSLLVAFISNGLWLLLPWRYLEQASQRARAESPDVRDRHGSWPAEATAR